MSEILNILKATHEGNLTIGNTNIEVAVLENGKRIITLTGVFKALGRPVRGTNRIDQIPPFMDAKSLQSLVNEELISVINKVEYLDKNGRKNDGYDANILPLVADLYLIAREKKILSKAQEETAVKAEILVRSLAKVGIIALVDEATGYQKDVDRAKDELQQILSKLLLTEQAKWIKTFPDEFFECIFRMKGWSWSRVAKKPQVLGHYINDFVYSRIAPSLLTELQKKNPKDGGKGVRKSKHHQWLTPDIGHPKLKEHLSGVMALARASGYNWVDFLLMLDRSYPKYGNTMEILFPLNPDTERENISSGDVKFDIAMKEALKKGKPRN